ncbi:MAG: hypothetical protein ACKVQS_08620 [Fimbriimonadaceae bacterium]
MGSDLVRVTVLDPGYSPDVLKLQCSLVGKFSNGNARGIEVTQKGSPSDSGGAMLVATFACDNLIDRQNERLNLDALVKGFLGSAKPMVNSFLIQFDGEIATQNTVHLFHDDTVMLEGKSLKNPNGIEYRVETLTQDTRLVNIPGSLAEVPPQARPNVNKKAMNPLVLPILIGGIIVAGALVYFALVRPGHRSRKK